MIKIVKNLIAVILLSSINPAVFARDRWYQIEVIVFQQKAPNTEVFEQSKSEIFWPKNVVTLAKTYTTMAASLLAPVAYEQFKGDDLLLKDAYYQIHKKSEYQPIKHLSWLQSVSSNAMSDAVKIHKNSKAKNDLLNGFVRIQRGHYLHLLVDLEFQPAAMNTNLMNDGESAVIYRLKEKRRIKLNEVHYLDHPKFGLIATVKPIETTAKGNSVSNPN